MVEAILFALMAAAAIAGALAVVLARNPVYAAMGLMLTLFALAVIYVVHLAHFVAAVQVIVYAGAVMTLFLFVIMFIGVDRAEHFRERLPFQRQTAVAALVVLVVLTALMVRSDQWSWVLPANSGQETNGTIEAIGSRLIVGETEEEAALGVDARGWLLPFEATSILVGDRIRGGHLTRFLPAETDRRTVAESTGRRGRELMVAAELYMSLAAVLFLIGAAGSVAPEQCADHVHVGRAHAQRCEPHLRGGRSGTRKPGRADGRVLRVGRGRSRSCGRARDHRVHLPNQGNGIGR